MKHLIRLPSTFHFFLPKWESAESENFSEMLEKQHQNLSY